MDRGKVTEVDRWLFGRPAWEMDAESLNIDERTPEELEEKGKELRRRMKQGSIERAKNELAVWGFSLTRLA
jgi:hypothetical protein